MPPSRPVISHVTRLGTSSAIIGSYLAVQVWTSRRGGTTDQSRMLPLP
jgi:hypothetical protein